MSTALPSMLLVGLSAILMWAGAKAIRAGRIMIDSKSPIRRDHQPVMFWLVVAIDFVVSAVCLSFVIAWWR